MSVGGGGEGVRVALLRYNNRDEGGGGVKKVKLL